MKKLIAVTALTLMCGAAFAQNTGPQPQTDTMQKPMDKGSMDKSSMNDGMNKGTTGMNDKGNPKKEMSKDGSPSAGSKDMKK